MIKRAAKVRAAPYYKMVKLKIEKLGSAKRFGARYGTKPKQEFAKIEKEQRKRHKCPYCNNVAVKRIAMGIWHCRKCDAKFTGKAYTVAKPILAAEAVPEEKEEEILEKVSEDAEEGA